MLYENDEIQSIKGIGPKKNAALNEIGIYKVIDLINYLPIAYKNRGNFIQINDATNGQKVLIKAKSKNKSRTIFIKRNNSKTSLTFESCGVFFDVVYFNQPYMMSNFTQECEYVIYGTVYFSKNTISVYPTAVESVSKNIYLKEGIYPVYKKPQYANINERQISKFIDYALDNMVINEQIPLWIHMQLNLDSALESYKQIHRPKNEEEVYIANKYFKLGDFLELYAAVSTKKNVCSGVVINSDGVNDFLDLVGFSLTDEQSKALHEIFADMSSSHKMNRLLQGDVGSGKTVVAVASAYVVAKNNYQAIITAPTEILARQHYDKYKDILSQLGINSTILYSKMKKGDRLKNLESIKNGSIKIIFGTHAVISEDVEYKNPALIVIDEQHRYGVNQRASLEQKGINVHTLVMSATPIPRTLSLCIYKDLDLSVIKTLPSGRKPIRTIVANVSDEGRILATIRQKASEGLKTYIVCPAIDAEDMQNVQTVYSHICDRLPELKILCLSGRDKGEDKDRIMEKFANEDYSVLVSTSLIEVGIDVKKAVLMWVKDAHRFGLNQLHQLRGRVGRSIYESICILESDNDSEVARARLEVLSSTQDGFEIAKKDLAIRGAGEAFGSRQSGKVNMIIEEIIEYEELYLKLEDIYDKLRVSDKEMDIKYLKKIEQKAKIKYKDIVLN